MRTERLPLWAGDLTLAGLHAFGRRAVPWVGTGLIVAMIAFSYASQLLTLTSFYA